MLKNAMMLFLLLMAGFCQAQKTDTIFLKGNVPVRNGYILNKQQSPCVHYNDPTAYFYTSGNLNDSVFSFNKCRVFAVFETEGDSSFILRSGKRFFTYMGLKNCRLKKGMEIRRGEYLGKMGYNEDDKEYMISLIMVYKHKSASIKELLHVIKKIR